MTSTTILIWFRLPNKQWRVRWENETFWRHYARTAPFQRWRHHNWKYLLMHPTIIHFCRLCAILWARLPRFSTLRILLSQLKRPLRWEMIKKIKKEKKIKIKITQLMTAIVTKAMLIAMVITMLIRTTRKRIGPQKNTKIQIPKKKITRIETTTTTTTTTTKTTTTTTTTTTTATKRKTATQQTQTIQTQTTRALQTTWTRSISTTNSSNFCQTGSHGTTFTRHHRHRP